MSETIITPNDGAEQVVVAPVVEATETPTETASGARTTDEKVKFGLHTLVEIILYVLGAILIILCLVKLGQDLDTYGGEFRFSEESYVGGDAYNYIISAARSSAVMVKSLIYGVLGCSSVISGLLIRIANKK